MEFTFNDEQRELRSAAQRFLQAVSTPEQVDKVMKTDAGYDPETWTRICEELGWVALTIPETYGGLGLNQLDLHPLMEEFGRQLYCGPFFSTVCLGTNAILCAATEEQKQMYLPAVAEGRSRLALAHAERSGRWNVAGIDAAATLDADEYVLSGEKSFVVDGHTADLLVVAARDAEDRIGLFMVPADSEGVQRERLPTMDQTRKLARVVLDDVRVPENARLGGEEDASRALETTLDLAITALAAEQVGAAERCLEMAVEYAKVRKQFGRAIGSFQAIKHKCADMLTRVESARSAAFYASACAAHGDKGFAEAAAAAKVFCSEAFFECAAENLQIHGGIGFTWEHPAHLYLKRAQSSKTLLGSPRYHRARVADYMGL